MKRKILTDHGTFYYEIAEYKENEYSQVYLYEKRFYNFILFKIPYYKQLREGSGYTNGWYKLDKVNNSEQYLNRLRDVLKRVVKNNNEAINYDPEWDGVLIEDPKKRRDKIIDDMLDEDINWE